MPTYNITDPKSGRKLKVTGDSPPTEAELEEIFASSSTPSAPKEEDEGFLGGVGNRIKEDLGGLLSLPDAITKEGSGQGLEDPLVPNGITLNPIEALVKVMTKGALKSGQENATGFLQKADQEPDNSGMRQLQAILSTLPIPGFGRTVESGDRAVMEGSGEGAGELGYDAMAALMPKIAPPIGSAIKGVGAAVGAPIRSNAISRLARIQSVPSEPLPRVPTPWRSNPISWARSGFEEVSNMLRSPTAARGQIKLADMLDPHRKIAEPLPEIPNIDDLPQGSSAPPIEFDPNVKRPVPVRERPDDMGQFPGSFPEEPFNLNPVEGPLSSMAKDVRKSPVGRHKNTRLTPEEESLAHEQYMESPDSAKTKGMSQELDESTRNMVYLEQLMEELGLKAPRPARLY